MTTIAQAHSNASEENLVTFRSGELSPDEEFFFRDFCAGYRTVTDPHFRLAVPGLESEPLAAQILPDNPDMFISIQTGKALSVVSTKEPGGIRLIDPEKTDTHMLRRIFSATVLHFCQLCEGETQDDREPVSTAIEALGSICLDRSEKIVPVAARIYSPLYVAEILWKINGYDSGRVLDYLTRYHRHITQEAEIVKRDKVLHPAMAHIQRQSLQRMYELYGQNAR